MKDRVKKIRKDAALTMEQFGDKIGIKKASVSLIESGRNNPSDQTIKIICKEFGVNEDWLMFGFGEPYRQLSVKEELAEFFADVLNEDDDSIKVQFIETIAQFGPDEWKLLAAFAEKFIKKNKG